jgi:hypothetical protein
MIFYSIFNNETNLIELLIFRGTTGIYLRLRSTIIFIMQSYFKPTIQIPALLFLQLKEWIEDTVVELLHEGIHIQSHLKQTTLFNRYGYRYSAISFAEILNFLLLTVNEKKIKVLKTVICRCSSVGGFGPFWTGPGYDLWTKPDLT